MYFLGALASYNLSTAWQVSATLRKHAYLCLQRKVTSAFPLFHGSSEASELLLTSLWSFPAANKVSLSFRTPCILMNLPEDVNFYFLENDCITLNHLNCKMQDKYNREDRKTS